uniref:Uncharacterized protein n=1 Tax=Anguilla anguilla TaxID=7936 RepID=A0A0E9UTC1_ANGAN
MMFSCATETKAILFSKNVILQIVQKETHLHTMHGFNNNTE